MNTLAVFGLAATVAIGTVLGVLLGMRWVEDRMIGSGSRRPRPAGSPARAPRTAVRTRMTRCTRRVGLAAMSIMMTGVTLAGTALSVGKQGKQSILAAHRVARASVPAAAESVEQ